MLCSFLKKSLFAIAVLTASWNASSLFGHVNQPGDFQIWFLESITTKVFEDIKITTEAEIRYGDNASLFYEYYIQSIIYHSPCEWFEWGPGYRQTYVLREADRKWLPRYIPYVDVKLYHEDDHWKFSDRNRFQYIIEDGGSKKWQYRNRFWVDSPWKWGSIEWNPYIWDEIFIRERDFFRENRLGIGFYFSIAENSKFACSYILRHLKHNDIWRPNHVIHIFYTMNF